MNNDNVKALIQKGVHIPNPESVFISDDVNLDRISSEKVTLYAGTKLIGKKTLILDNSAIGYEAPVTLEDTCVGKNCALNGGFFKGAVFAGNNSVGSGAHFREGTIFEEYAKAAHTVGLKQTILFPWVTLGSLINFCDCFMAGGTGPKNHSEVGSSFIHFNFTTNQDKATASMMGDVPKGVMLKSDPIFLGGQGGIVGPIQIGYGCTTAAGCVIRKSETRQNRLIFGGRVKDISIARQPDIYKSVLPIYHQNIHYIASLFALKAWYQHIRPLFGTDHLSAALIGNLQEALNGCIDERIKRFNHWCDKLIESKKKIAEQGTDASALIESHDNVLDKRGLCLDTFNKAASYRIGKNGHAFAAVVQGQANKRQDYISAVCSLTPDERNLGIKWLSGIQDNIYSTLSI
jgi:hypothetical protein